ncbi:hypothetical protein HZF05_12435 [Sphingomonas sp. CGMCC 1.13654]|uniref:Uncharacterized protein n=1 Tax=Sphingomonas chungangi TaxID=2683589 RepID=A0A838L798_9SPHN|nr:hypothetical protein [Sphingomonas chungangi]MBA2934907.1 hypothetical protein [Sphingomonas chungangi]MVW58218.1 hypothetical protein [Sphingomonas chungangi]
MTARHDKCFVQYGQHPVSDDNLKTLSQSWALGAPVRVIEPRGANLKCEFEIMKTLSAHGQHVAEFVARSEDLSPEDEKADQAERDAEAQKQAAKDAAAAAPAPLPQSALVVPGVTPPEAPAPRGRRLAAASGRSIAQAQNGVVTLTCTMADPTRPYQLDVIVNEEKGTVTPSRPDTGGGSEMKAVFMPDAVRFGPFTINRSSLHIWRQNASAMAIAAKQPPIVEGQCALADLRRVF